MVRLMVRNLAFDTPFGVLRDGTVEVQVDGEKIILKEPAVLRHETKAINLVLSSGSTINEILLPDEIAHLIAQSKENQK